MGARQPAQQAAARRAGSTCVVPSVSERSAAVRDERPLAGSAAFLAIERAGFGVPEVPGKAVSKGPM